MRGSIILLSDENRCQIINVLKLDEKFNTAFTCSKGEVRAR